MALSGTSQSSGGACSHKESPETRSTAFSPEDTRVMKLQKLPAPAFSLEPPASVNGAAIVSSGSNDPFVSSSDHATANSISADLPGLSPTASTFTPMSAGGFMHTWNTKAFGLSSNTVTELGYLTATSVPDTPGKHSNNPMAQEAEISSIGQSLLSASTSPSNVAPVSKTDQFSTDSQLSRSLFIFRVIGTTGTEICHFFSDKEELSSLKHIGLANLMTDATVYVTFADIRDAQKALLKILKDRAKWGVRFIDAKQPAAYRGLPDIVRTSMYAAQIIVNATSLGTKKCTTVSHLIKERLASFGEVMAFGILTVDPQNVTVRAEYYDTRVAELAVTVMNGTSLAGCILNVSYYQPLCALDPHLLQQDRELDGCDIENVNVTHVQRSHDLIEESSSPGQGSNSLPMLRNDIPYCADVNKYTSYIGAQLGSFHVNRQQFHAWEQYQQPGTIGQERTMARQTQFRPSMYREQTRGGPKMNGRHSREYASNHHNVVSIDNIRRGLDVRTTIMLRNIPNKIGQPLLKAIVDETSLGKYDFMYLRIDFANNCNVGYAFINFEDPWDMIEFVTKMAGRRWNRFGSEKKAEVSYATIQGRDCLIAKFRNSSVMLEHPSFRPKLFVTGDSELTGQELEFPGPDNVSKMRRSVENAAHVGLFAPRAGQHFRDEQRRRRSQYDRGTRFAEMEDSYAFDDYEQYGNDESIFTETFSRRFAAPGAVSSQSSHAQFSNVPLAFGQFRYNQPFYDPSPYGQSAYGPSSYGQSQFDQSQYGQSPYGQSPHNQSWYSPSSYAQSPYRSGF